MARNSTDPLKREKDRFSLQKEILETLFDFPVRSEETPKKVRLVREVRRSRAFAKPLFEPHNDAAREPKPSASETQAVTCEGANYHIYAAYNFEEVLTCMRIFA